MALQHRTDLLFQAMNAPVLDTKAIKFQLDMITWLQAGDISKALVDELGLRHILEHLATNTQFEESLRLDAERLLARWRRGVYDAPHNEQRQTAPGTNDLVVGDCWPSRKAAWREGCHGMTQAGIHGNNEYGAYSIVANGMYNDQDKGDKIWYSGTDAKKKGIPSAHTKLMIRSLETGKPVRVIRGSNCGRFAPVKGCRYDGLYVVTDKRPPPRRFTASAKEEGNWEFLLERVPGQPPIQMQKPDNETLLQWQNRQLYETTEK